MLKRFPLALAGQDRGLAATLVVLVALGLLVPVFNLVVGEGSFLHIPTYLVSLMGKYLCYALLAVAVDLI